MSSWVLCQIQCSNRHNIGEALGIYNSYLSLPALNVHCPRSPKVVHHQKTNHQKRYPLYLCIDEVQSCLLDLNRAPHVSHVIVDPPHHCMLVAPAHLNIVHYPMVDLPVCKGPLTMFEVRIVK